jgi:ZIP family zinc transporter
MFDQNVILAFVLSAAAGFSTLLGAVVVLFLKKKNEKLITASLGFAAGVMICISFIELYPEGRLLLSGLYGNVGGTLTAAAFFLAGLVIAILIDRLTPHEEFSPQTGERAHPDLYRLGIISTLTIALHNLPEGLATFMSVYENTTLGISVAIAIAMHNIPEGISVAMPIYYSTGSRKKAFFFCFLSGITEPIGALLAFFLLRPFLGPAMLGMVFAFISGIMVYIAIEELMPSSRQYGHGRLALLSTFAGIMAMFMTQIF